MVEPGLPTGVDFEKSSIKQGVMEGTRGRDSDQSWLHQLQQGSQQGTWTIMHAQ